MAEQIVLDPSEVATSRTAFDITPWVKADGIDWGDAAITAYMAQSQRGELPVDYRIPNRTVTIPLSVRNVGGTTFHTARGLVQAKAAMFQTEGGWLKRVASSGGTAYLDVVNATLHLGGGWDQAYKDFDVAATLTLEATPDFYGNEVDLGDNTSTNSYVIFTETGIAGNYPARCRIVVDDDQPISRLGLMWAARSKNYTSSAANGILFPASELTAMDTSIGTNWTSLFSTDRDSGTAPTGALVHQGTHRVWLRVQVGTTHLEFRLLWDVGDMTLPVANPPVSTEAVYAATNTRMFDLGEVRLDAPPTGTHRWKGLIQARSLGTGGATVTVQELWVVPVDEGYGILRASLENEIGMAAYSGRDEFDQAAGALAGKTAAVGGTWVGAGEADDFAVETTGKTAQRTAVSDTTYRLNTLNLNMTATAVQTDFKASSFPSGQTMYLGVVARYVDASNWMFAALLLDTLGHQLQVTRRVGGVDSIFHNSVLPRELDITVYNTIRLAVNAGGHWAVWLYPASAAGGGDPVAVGYSSLLATGGTLITGDVGIVDFAGSATAVTRNYDNFAAWVPPADAVIYSGQSIELRTDGMFREDSSGSAYGPVADVIGDLPRLPPATPEAPHLPDPRQHVTRRLRPASGRDPHRRHLRTSLLPAQLVDRPRQLDAARP